MEDDLDLETGVVPLDKIAYWNRLRMMNTFSKLAKKLATLLESGLPLLEAVQYLQDRKVRNERMDKLLSTASQAIMQGQTLSDAWRGFLPPVIIATLELGNESGQLASSLRAHAEHMDQQQAWLGRLGKVVVYPVLLFLGNLTVEFLVAQILIPEFEQMYATTNVSLGNLSLLMIQIVRWLPRLLLLFCFTGFVCGVFVLLVHQNRVWGAQRLAPYLPGHKLMVALRTQKLSFSLWTLMEGGTPVLEALAVLTRTSGDKWLRTVSDKLRNRLLAGWPVAQSFTDLTDSLLVSMLILAEQTGDVPKALMQTQQLLAQDTATHLERSLRWLEPGLLLLMGLLLALTMYVLFVPMYTMMSDMAAHIT